MLGNDHLLPEVLVQASPVSSSSSTPAAVLSSSLLSDDCNIARLQLLATRSGASMDNIQLIRSQPEIIKCMDSLKRSPQDKLSICENNDNVNTIPSKKPPLYGIHHSPATTHAIAVLLLVLSVSQELKLLLVI